MMTQAKQLSKQKQRKRTLSATRPLAIFCRLSAAGESGHSEPKLRIFGREWLLTASKLPFEKNGRMTA
jgi:hypothetical protein